MHVNVVHKGNKQIHLESHELFQGFRAAFILDFSSHITEGQGWN